MGDVLLAILAAVGLYLVSDLRVLREYERAVYFFLLRVMAVDFPPVPSLRVSLVNGTGRNACPERVSQPSL